ncbi:MAG TPA: sodium:solute symporter family protein [Bacteroidales bacterium]|nr:sodium:solute symporter family protein [Bacteroidales bacterium]
MVALVLVYLAVTIIIGLLAGRLVRNSEDFLLAGRRLPLLVVAATLFATWYGSETILGASTEFIQGGLIAVVRDPFGAALCLFLVGLFFARPLYRMKLLTLGDFYRVKYGPRIEFFASVCIMLSYFAWIAAQFVAFGIISSALIGTSLTEGILLATALVTLYTFVGGMWAVSITDFMQSIFIITGLILASIQIFGIVDLYTVLADTPEGFFGFLPDADITSLGNYFAAWITIGLGSISTQVIFQRVMSAKSEKVAVRGSYIAGFMYLSFGLIPLALALAAPILMPEFISSHSGTPYMQMLLPNLVEGFTSPFVQVMFFGALLSAVLSTASSALLAPAAIMSENILKPMMGNVSDRKLLWLTRFAVLAVSVVALALALHRGDIYNLVGLAASVGLTSLFVPFAAGLFWKKATATAAFVSMMAGLVVWAVASLVATEINPVLYGFVASMVGMWLGSYLQKN